MLGNSPNRMQYLEQTIDYLGQEVRLKIHLEIKKRQIATPLHCAVLETRLGLVGVASSTRGLCQCSFVSDRESFARELAEHAPTAELRFVSPGQFAPLIDLLNGQASSPIELSLHLIGTAFACRVWLELISIPTAEVRTYAGVAAAIGQPRATRAVGSAVGRNPIVPLIPCHRVIRSDGQIGGYSGLGGRERKASLLALERSQDK